MNDPFPAYAPSEEHELLRKTVRELAEDTIAPAAADVDEKGRFPQEALDALNAAGLSAVHIPEAYGGEGADALATVIVIEEVARVCGSSSLIPAVNKLGTVPVLLSGSEELKQRFLAPVARGEAMFSYCLSEAGAGSDAASMKTRAVREGDSWVLNGTKMWITNAGVSQYYTVMAVTDPDAGAQRHLRLRRRQGRSRRELRRAGEEARHQGLSRPARSSSRTRGFPRTGLSARRVPGSGRRSPPWTTPGSRSPPRPWASPRARWTTPPATCSSASSSASRWPASRACSSCWPTWP